MSGLIAMRNLLHTDSASCALTLSAVPVATSALVCAFGALLDPEGGGTSPGDFRQQSGSPGSALSSPSRRQPLSLSNGAARPPPSGPCVTFVVGGEWLIGRLDT